MLTDTQSIQNFLNTNLQPQDFFFVVTFPKDALAIETIFPYNIVCFDDHPIIDQIAAKKINIFSLDRVAKDHPKRRSTSVLLKHPQTAKWINSISDNPQIIVFKPSPSLEKICEINHWQLIANPAELNRHFENKINFTTIANELQLPQPLHLISKLHQINYDTLINQLGPNFFLQFPRGFAGSSTFEIKSESDFHHIQSQYLDYPTKFSQKIVGPTFSLNACATRHHGIIIQKPFFQITNIPELNSSPGGTCGNIYSHDLSVIRDLPQLFHDIHQFGQLLIDQHYRGIFGIDFIIDQTTGQYFFIECNPRLTASIPMISKLQIKNNEIPLLALHLLELTNQNYQLDPAVTASSIQSPAIGSQIIFRNINQTTIPTPIALPSGIYHLPPEFTNIYQIKDCILQSPQNLQFIRPGIDILDIHNQDEFLLLSEPSSKPISPDIEYLRIQTLQ